MAGYVQIEKKVNDSGIVDYGLKALGLLAWLHLNVNWKQSIWRGEIIEPGQMITSIHNLSAKVYESDKVIRGLLNKLEAMGELKREVRANKWTKLIVCNYVSYNKNEKAKGEHRDQQSENRGQGKGETIEQKNKLISLFSVCWKIFGKYGKEKEAFEIWSNLSDENHRDIIKKIPDYLNHITEKRQRKKFFENWLYSRDWEMSYGDSGDSAPKIKPKSFTIGMR